MVTEYIKTRPFISFSFLCIVSVLLYSTALNTPFKLDDNPKIINNPDIKSLSNIKTKLVYPYNPSQKISSRNDPSRPITYLTYTLNYYFAKLNPLWYNITDLLIHLANSFLLLYMFMRLLLLISGEKQVLIPFISAAIFMMHPVNSVDVLYVYNRGGELALFFIILSFIFFSYSAGSIAKPAYSLSLICFVLAILSRQDAAVFPAALLSIDFIIHKKLRLKMHLSFWLLLIIYLMFRQFYLGGLGDVEAGISWHRAEYLLIQPYALFRYIKMFILPYGLSFDHQIARPASILDTRIILSLIALLLIVAVLYKMHKKSNPLNKKLIFISAAWFILFITPSSSIFPTTTGLADNRLYIPMIGLCLMTAMAYQHFSRKKFHIMVSMILLFHLSLLSALTYKRALLFANPVKLWKDVIKQYPGHCRAYNNLGLQYKEKGRYREALSAYARALKIKPDYVNAYNNIGVILMEAGNFEKAANYYKKALEIMPENAEIHYNLATVYKNAHQYNKAEAEFEKAIELNPNIPVFYNNLGILHSELGKYKKAIQNFKKAIKLEPGYISAYNNLGITYKKKGAYNSALKIFGMAMDNESTLPDLFNNRATVYIETGDLTSAIKDLKKATSLKPDYAEAYANMGKAYYKQGDLESSLKEYRKALELNPSLLSAMINLAVIYYNTQRYREAETAFNQILEKYPGNNFAQEGLRKIKNREG